MSPARSYVEQTRNTLLFASCAKEVSTNAKVNVVISDKLLVKQLQRELARLEAELRNSGSTRRKPDSAELLREKDLQIEMVIIKIFVTDSLLIMHMSSIFSTCMTLNKISKFIHYLQYYISYMLFLKIIVSTICYWSCNVLKSMDSFTLCTELLFPH
jgi:ABC-type multidrug transport system permease subunit